MRVVPHLFASQCDRGRTQHLRGLCELLGLQELDIPEDLKALYKTVWEIKQRVLLDMAADRGAFIDQSQSFNVHMSDPNFGKLTSLHFYAWKVCPRQLHMEPRAGNPVKCVSPHFLGTVCRLWICPAQGCNLQVSMVEGQGASSWQVLPGLQLPSTNLKSMLNRLRDLWAPQPAPMHLWAVI